MIDIPYRAVIFPLFWMLGTLVLVVQLHPIPEECGGKPAIEQADQLMLLRSTEEKWGYRCLAASIVFLIIVGITVVVVIVVKSR